MIHSHSLQAEYTRGSIVIKMLKTAVAMLASTLAMSAYNIADTFFVGRLGGEAPLAAMGFSFPVVMLVGCFFGGFGGGCMTTMAQALGAGDQNRVQRIVTSGTILLLLLSFFFAVIGTLFSSQIYGLLGASGETLQQLKGYMDIWFYGCCTASIAMLSNQLMISAGKPKFSSAMTIFGMVINVILDPLFIFGSNECALLSSQYLPGWLSTGLSFFLLHLPRVSPMGIRGAALATVFSQCISTIAGLYLLYDAGLLSFKGLSRPHILESWSQITRYAIPNILGMLLFPLTNYVVTWVTASFGDSVVAAVAAAGKLEQVAFVLPMAFGIPLMSIIAQNYGAGLYSRVRFAYRFASIMALIFLFIMAILLFFFSPKLVPFFTPEQEIQSLMIRCLRIVSWGFALLELTRFSGFALTGCGHPRQDAILKGVRMVGILIPLSMLTKYYHWLPGVFYSRLVTDILGGIISISCAVAMLRKLPADHS